MTYEEAKKLKRFRNPCTCGGHAWSMSGRDPEDPHTHWCPQRAEYLEYRLALKKDTKEK